MTDLSRFPVEALDFGVSCRMPWTFGDWISILSVFNHRDEPVRLEPQVLSLLIHLVRNRGHMLTKDEIFTAVWQGLAVSDVSISSRIRSARQASGDDGARQSVIQTVHGRGFRFVAEVTERANTQSAIDAAPRSIELPA